MHNVIHLVQTALHLVVIVVCEDQPRPHMKWLAAWEEKQNFVCHAMRRSQRLRFNKTAIPRQGHQHLRTAAGQHIRESAGFHAVIAAHRTNCQRLVCIELELARVVADVDVPELV